MFGVVIIVIWPGLWNGSIVNMLTPIIGGPNIGPRILIAIVASAGLIGGWMVISPRLLAPREVQEGDSPQLFQCWNCHRIQNDFIPVNDLLNRKTILSCRFCMAPQATHPLNYDEGVAMVVVGEPKNLIGLRTETEEETNLRVESLSGSDYRLVSDAISDKAKEIEKRRGETIPPALKLSRPKGKHLFTCRFCKRSDFNEPNDVKNHQSGGECPDYPIKGKTGAERKEEAENLKAAKSKKKPKPEPDQPIDVTKIDETDGGTSPESDKNLLAGPEEKSPEAANPPGSQ